MPVTSREWFFSTPKMSRKSSDAASVTTVCSRKVSVATWGSHFTSSDAA